MYSKKRKQVFRVKKLVGPQTRKKVKKYTKLKGVEYTEGLPPSLLRSSSIPTAELCSGWDASWASCSCAQLSCVSEVHTHPSSTQPDLPRLESPLTWPAQRVESLSKTNYKNSFSVSYWSFFSSCFQHAVLYCVVSMVKKPKKWE